MGNERTHAWRPIAPHSLSTEQEDARLNAFFLSLAEDPDQSPWVTGTILWIEAGQTARDAWSVDNLAEGGTAAFLRATWLDDERGIISYGYKEGDGLTYIWKARYSADHRTEEVAFLHHRPGSAPIEEEEALALWYSGEGVVALT
jgi:hypothetical protein